MGVLVVATVVLITLGAIGTGVTSRLDPTTLEVPGTESQRGTELLRDHFGNSAPFVILLRGPAAAIDRQGPELIRALRRDPKVTTLSPWDTGSVHERIARPSTRTVHAPHCARPQPNFTPVSRRWLRRT